MIVLSVISNLLSSTSNELFNLVIIFFSSIIPWFFFTSSIICQGFLFSCFKNVYNCLLKDFYDDCFNIFVSYFQHLSHLGVSIYLLSVVTHFPGSLVSNFFSKLYLGHLGYYVMRTCILFKSFLANIHFVKV